MPDITSGCGVHSGSTPQGKQGRHVSSLCLSKQHLLSLSQATTTTSQASSTSKNTATPESQSFFTAAVFARSHTKAQ